MFLSDKFDVWRTLVGVEVVSVSEFGRFLGMGGKYSEGTDGTSRG